MSLAKEAAESLQLELGGPLHTNKRGYMVRCPCHEDKGPSLSLRDGDRAPLLAPCFASCDGTDIMQALNARGLLPRMRRDEKRSKTFISEKELSFAKTVIAIAENRAKAGEVFDDYDLGVIKKAKNTLSMVQSQGGAA